MTKRTSNGPACVSTASGETCYRRGISEIHRERARLNAECLLLGHGPLGGRRRRPIGDQRVHARLGEREVKPVAAPPLRSERRELSLTYRLALTLT